jgi:hypothetical protein
VTSEALSSLGLGGVLITLGYSAGRPFGKVILAG